MALALFSFALFGYFFAGLGELLSLPSPMSLFGWIPTRFFAHGHFRSTISVDFTSLYKPRTELRLLLALLAAAFVCVYFAPVRLKRPLIVFWFLVGATTLFGLTTALGLLAAHLCIYVVFHPRGADAERAIGVGVALSVALVLLGLDALSMSGAVRLALAGAAGLGVWWAYPRWIVGVLAAPVPGRSLRLAATHLPLLVLSAGTLLGALAGTKLAAPLSLVLLFWHYMRLLMYGIDVEDGLAPDDQPVLTYLSVFFSPATLDTWPYGISIAQGYSYQSERFLSRDKNRIALDGLALLGIALLYMSFGPLLVATAVDLLGRAGVVAYFNITAMLRVHLTTHDVATSTVLVTSLLHHIEWIFLIGGLFHFKVGIWRLLGYDVEPYMRFPLLATNMVTLWRRLTFHWRAVLVRGFYYPVFLRLAGWPMWVRTTLATLVAAGVANWLWAHLTEALAGFGMSWESFLLAFRMWPYFLFLGGGIAVAQLWVTWRGRRRRHWTLDRWLPLDVLGAYVTAQFYGIIHIFYSVLVFRGGSATDYWTIFLRGFGLA